MKPSKPSRSSALHAHSSPSLDAPGRPAAAHQAAQNPVEVAQVRKGILGWVLVPKDPHNFPLLTRMFGASGTTCEEVRTPLNWSSLEQGLQELRAVARDTGLCLRLCGNLSAAPIVQLWEKAPTMKAQPLESIFAGAGLSGNAGVWSVSDMREPHLAVLSEALSSGRPFTTGWFSAKKEVQSACISRAQPRGRVFLEVAASMDEGVELVDSAVWVVVGRELDARNGLEALLKLGFQQGQAESWLEQRVQEISELGELEEGGSIARRAYISAAVGTATLLGKVEALIGECDQDLEAVFDRLKERCRCLLAKKLKAWRRAQGPSTPPETP